MELVACKELPADRETWVPILGGEFPFPPPLTLITHGFTSTPWTLMLLWQSCYLHLPTASSEPCPTFIMECTLEACSVGSARGSYRGSLAQYHSLSLEDSFSGLLLGMVPNCALPCCFAAHFLVYPWISSNLILPLCCKIAVWGMFSCSCMCVLQHFKGVWDATRGMCALIWTYPKEAKMNNVQLGPLDRSCSKHLAYQLYFN